MRAHDPEKYSGHSDPVYKQEKYWVQLGAGSEPVQVYCQMSIDGGGWTGIYVANEGNNMEYRYADILQSTASDIEALVGSIDHSGNFVSKANYMQFLLPHEWRYRPPMSFFRSSALVNAKLNGHGPYPFDVVYGYDSFVKSSNVDACSAGHWMDVGGYSGQVCLDVQTARVEQLAPSLNLCDTETSFNDLAYHPLHPCGGQVHCEVENGDYCGRVIETLPWQTITMTVTQRASGYSGSNNGWTSGSQLYVIEGDCPTYSPSSHPSPYVDYWHCTSDCSVDTGSSYSATSTTNRMCIMFRADVYETSSFTADITCSAALSPWFNNFATGAPGTSPSLQMDQPAQQVHCNDLSSGSKWDLQPCSVNKRLAIFVREVDCSQAPDCSALHRVGCYSTPNTCGLCLSGHEAAPGDSNEPCTASGVQPWQPEGTQVPQQPAADCAVLKVQQPNAQTGAYQLGTSDDSYASVCNMNVDGGGWTAILLSGADSLHYLVEPTQFPSTTALEVLVGFLDSNYQLFKGNARFLMPPQWRRRPPTSYVQRHQKVSVHIDSSAEQQTTTLVYGYSDFAGQCNYTAMPSSGTYRGSLCFLGIDGAPWWNGFASGSWGGALSASSSAGNCVTRSGDDAADELQCSDARRFVIFVRPIACDGVPHECGSGLNREACFDVANTCGNCSSGFVGTTGHSNEPCAADCSALNAATCTSLHRNPCDPTATGTPNTCGACLDGYVGEEGPSNTLCTLEPLVEKPLESCYAIHAAHRATALTGQYVI
eukprot:COSAG01_NODE_9653_length_2379_cov_1.225439_1_plen_764_part_01